MKVNNPMLKTTNLTLSKQVADGIYRITLPLPGKRPGPVNVYLFAGRDHTALLDTGTAKGFNVLERALSEHGLAMGDLDRIVLTHSHVDHYGGVNRIQAAVGAPVEVAGNFERPVSIATGLNVSRKTLGSFLALMGVPLVIRSAMRALSSGFALLGDKCDVTQYLQEGDHIQLGDYEFQVLETPGHTLDSICLYNDATGMLFSGDHILPHITPNAFVMLEEESPLPVRMSQKEFYDSLERVRALSPDVVFPAHGTRITDLDGVVRMYRDSFEKREAAIVDIIAAGQSSVYAIARKLFPNMDRTRLPLEIFLAASEVYTHLQVLDDKGVVSMDASNDVLRVRIR
ncbi:MAG: MBL fold metallo-hydrolase [Thermodesulfobacteriota bacterium]|nr:MBL fold metallo-hydrolase [Thermodesulfobacteriota bacterium]